MRIKFEYKRKDQLYFNIRSLFQFPSLFIIILFFTVNAAVNTEYFHKYGLVFYIVYLLFFMICFIIFIILITGIIMLISSITRSQKSILCGHEIEFSDEYFIEKTELNENKYLWGAVTKSISNRYYFLLYVSGSTAHVIPKRDLTLSEVEQIEKILKEKNLIK